MTDIAVFVSGGGSNMQALLDTIEDGKIKGRVRLVLSSTDKAYALQRAHAAGIRAQRAGEGNAGGVKGERHIPLRSGGISGDHIARGGAGI